PTSKRKIPDLVFPTRKVTIEESIEETKSTGKGRRKLLFLLLIATIAWAGYEKQKELTHFWGYKALPKIVEVFPDLFPQSYLQYWAEKARQEQATETANTDITKVTPAETAQTTLTTSTPPDTTQPEVVAAEESLPVEKELTRDEKIEQLKAELSDKPVNAIKLAGIYKEMLSEMPQSPVARKGLKELRDWTSQQIRMAFDAEDAVLARKHIDIVKQSFPRVAQTNRFIRLEKKVIFLERIDNHFSQAEKYFNAGAISKPIGKNALYEVQKVLILAPGNEDAKAFLNKIALSYIDKTTQLQQQGNVHNALLMLEEGIAAMNNHPALLEKRANLKNQIKHKKEIASLFIQAKKYMSAGQLIKPVAYNAYDLYQDILKKDAANLEAKAGIKTIHQLVAKDITSLIHKGELKSSEEYLRLAIDRYGKTSLLANVQLKLNDALEVVAPRIQNIILSHAPVTKVPATTSNSGSGKLKDTQTLRLNTTLYAGFSFINFDPGTTWLEAALIDNTRERTILQKPVVVSSQFGEHFFEIKLPARGLQKSIYTVELKLKNKVLITRSFLVLN
ncbi:MAG: hypothetical protein OEY78_11120, partial [Gammaproteobacteria bacterium]|nr:hypothetical protein [Gammaproteobacteria bacterium]